MKENEMKEIAVIINRALAGRQDNLSLKECLKRVKDLVEKFPLYPDLTEKR